jgi:hypothetical protein
MKLDSTKTQKPTWNATWMAIRPRYESYRVPESETNAGIGIRLHISYSGVTSTCGGSRLPAVNTTSSSSDQRIFRRAIQNATNDDRNRVMTTAGTATISELVKYLGSSAESQTCA